LTGFELFVSIILGIFTNAVKEQKKNKRKAIPCPAGGVLFLKILDEARATHYNACHESRRIQIRKHLRDGRAQLPRGKLPTSTTTQIGGVHARQD